MLALSLIFLLPVMANGQYIQPPWYDRIKAEFDAVGDEEVRRCFKRGDVPPQEGARCARNQKTCFFGTQSCPNGLLHPVTKCDCPGSPNNQWSCAQQACPTGVDADTTLESNNLGRYPGYPGTLTPAGSVKVKFFEDESMQFSYDVSGLPANCDRCGVHIHTGKF